MKAATTFFGKDLQLRESVNYATRTIKKLIEQFGPREPGSEAELNAQKAMATDLEQWADSVEIEDFQVHRKAFLGFIPYTVLTGIASIVLFWLGHYLLASILMFTGVLPLVVEFGMYKQLLDPLFPAQTSHNVIARRAPKGALKRRIFLVGHADSQYEWTLNYKLGGKGMMAVMVPAIVFAIVSLLANLLFFILSAAHVEITGFLAILYQIFRYGMLIGIPFFIGVLFFQSWRRCVPGANDNLSGCFVAMGVLREMEKAGVRFQNTEVVAMLSGSEEAGLRGAKAYVKAHKKELQDPNIETIVVALDTFRDLDDMCVYSRDLSGTVKHNVQVSEMLRQAGENCGLTLPYSSIYIGASDGAAFTQGGIKASSLAAMDPTPPRYYHTRLDNWDILEPKAIEAGMAVMLETISIYDQQGLPQV